MKRILSILAISSSLFASGCWTTQELEDMAEQELNDVIVFSFKDAVTCENVSNAKIKFLGKTFITNSKGQIELSTPPEYVDANINLKFKKDGYIDFNQNILVSAQTCWHTKFLVSKKIPINSMRFILSWGKRPKDLDLHLVSSDFHLSYRNKKFAGNEAQLDRDARNGYGPETITLNRVKKNKKYKLYVYNYSNEQKYSGKANVAIYKNNSLNKIVSINKNSRCVEVAKIYNDKITYTMKSVSDKYCK